MIIEKNGNSCTVWVQQQERSSYRSDESYKAAVAESKSNGGGVCVFVSGDMPLIPTIEGLLNAGKFS